jgi:hypothetical protein
VGCSKHPPYTRSKLKLFRILLQHSPKRALQTLALGMPKRLWPQTLHTDQKELGDSGLSWQSLDLTFPWPQKSFLLTCSVELGSHRVLS